MIPDHETTHLYLADTLPKKYPSFYHRFEKVLQDCQIDFQLLPGTRDVWAVDYMPVQVDKNKFVQFVYDPDYLQTIKGRKSISDVDAICQAIDIKPLKTDIVIDGGNVVRAKDKVIMTDKVFTENPAIPQRDLIKRLEEILEIEKIVFLPRHPFDFTGHVDGIARFLDDNIVLINAGSPQANKKEKNFQLQLRCALHNAGFEFVEIPSNTSGNNNYTQANGEYLNYLQMKDVIVLPTFDIPEDELVARKIEELFPGITIATVNSNDIANNGGILNCITWNIVK
jgi:agmatine deiminase